MISRTHETTERSTILRSAGHHLVRAFSLLEVLVVVAIIALVAAVLLPSLRKAREQAKVAVCLSNLRQLHLAWEFYLAEWKGFFPQWMNIDNNYGGLQGTGSRAYGADPRRPQSKPLNKYCRMPLVTRTGGKTFCCPSDRGSEIQGCLPSFFEYCGTSYRTNVFLIGPNQSNVSENDPCESVMTDLAARLNHLNRTKIKNESKLLLIGEYPWFHMYEWSKSEDVTFHGRRFYYNVAFLDGHEETIWIHKGLHTTARYTVIPFGDLQAESVQCQQEVPCP